VTKRSPKTKGHPPTGKKITSDSKGKGGGQKSETLGKPKVTAKTETKREQGMYFNDREIQEGRPPKFISEE